MRNRNKQLAPALLPHMGELASVLCNTFDLTSEALDCFFQDITNTNSFYDEITPTLNGICNDMQAGVSVTPMFQLDNQDRAHIVMIQLFKNPVGQNQPPQPVATIVAQDNGVWVSATGLTLGSGDPSQCAVNEQTLSLHVQKMPEAGGYILRALSGLNIAITSPAHKLRQQAIMAITDMVGQADSGSQAGTPANKPGTALAKQSDKNRFLDVSRMMLCSLLGLEKLHKTYEDMFADARHDEPIDIGAVLYGSGELYFASDGQENTPDYVLNVYFVTETGFEFEVTLGVDEFALHIGDFLHLSSYPEKAYSRFNMAKFDAWAKHIPNLAERMDILLGMFTKAVGSEPNHIRKLKQRFKRHIMAPANVVSSKA